MNKKIDLKNNTDFDSNEKVEFLYQKLGAYWYGFTVVDGVLHYGRVSEEEVFAEELELQNQKDVDQESNDEKNA